MVGLAATGAQADNSGFSNKFSGYGTLAATTASKDDVGFRSGWYQGKGVGSNIDLGVDSRLGLQDVMTFNPSFSATGQLLVERRRKDGSLNSNDDARVGIEWLYGQYNLTPNLNVRVGRMALPAFMISDARNVGYAQPWLRAPLDVYAGMPLRSLDGIQGLWRTNLGPTILTVQPSYGSSPWNVAVGEPPSLLNPAGGTIGLKGTSRHVVNLAVSLDWDSWTARIAQTRGNTALSTDFFGVASFGLPPVNYHLKDRFTALGLQYDDGKALFMTEMTRRREDDLPGSAPASYAFVPSPLGGTLADLYASSIGGKPLAATTAFYVAGGWHFGNFLPMLALSQFKDDMTGTKYHSEDVSLRYDIRTNVAVKAQISHYQGHDANAFLNASATSKYVNVFALGVDFVF
jgi:hypothetical protein